MSQKLQGLDLLRSTIDNLFRLPAPVLLQPIFDYHAGDNAGPQVTMRLVDACDDAGLTFRLNEAVTSHNFRTLQCGFELGLFGLPAKRRENKGMILFHNVAPRLRIQPGVRNGEGLWAGILPDNVLVLGVNSGYSYSFIKPELLALFRIDVDDTDVQFRSRDLYPDVLERLLTGDFAGVTPFRTIEEAHIPDVPANRIMAVDNYGNLKTTIDPRSIELEDGTPISARIGGKKVEGVFKRNLTFSAGEGRLAFAPGSSIHRLSTGNRGFMELFRVGGNASNDFGGVAPEAEVIIETQESLVEAA